MVFSSTVFLFYFLPVTLTIYFLFEKFLPRMRNPWLIFVSLVFFGWNQIQYVYVIMGCIAVNYLGARFIDKAKGNGWKKAGMTITVVLNLASLFYFKYFNFCVEQLENLSHKSFQVEEVILPIGISFFTFQGLSYVLDVYMNRTKVQKNIASVGLYILLFPQLIAGPIVRYTDIEKNISERRTSFEDALDGTRRFVVGLFKKAVIANSLAATVDAIWVISPLETLTSVAWLGAIGYTLQIYFDFSGYSDMAIGLGRILGFHFPGNFNYPYIATSITDFWRRWHMSLSGWFRDYVYIPLGGNRKHQFRNVFIVFLLTGIWHGASWTFVVWGLWHGLFRMLELLLHQTKKRRDESLWRSLFRRIYSLLVIVIGWVFFRAETLKDAVQYLGRMFGALKVHTPGFQLGWYLNHYTIFILLVAMVLSTPLSCYLKKKGNKLVGEDKTEMITNGVLILMLVISLVCVVASTYNPFIYFQF